MGRGSLIGWSLIVVLLAGCGGSGKAPLTGGGATGTPTGSLQGRLVTTGTRQVVASRFLVRLHGSDAPIAVQVNADGTFRLDNVPAGQQTLTVEDSQSLQGAVIVCFVRPGAVTDIGEVMPQSLGKISGIVREVDENGDPVKPVAHARVLAHPLQTGQEALQDLSERPVFATRTDASGSYQLLVPTGNYLVEVQHPDYEPAAQTATVQALSTTALDFGVRLRPRQTGTVVGTVRTQWNGQTVPIAGALVALLPKGASLQPLNVGSVVSTLAHSKPVGQRPLFTFTKADGSFELTGVPAGDYTAFAFKRGLGQDSKEITVQANATVQVTFLLQAQLGLIQGRVTDAATGQPIAGATVIAVRAGDPFWDWEDWQASPDDREGGKPKWHRPKTPHPGGNPSAPNFPPLPPFEPPVRVGTLTDANGNYQLPVPAGTYFVAAGAEGYEWQAQEMTVTVNTSVTADFALNKTQAIAGIQD